MTAFASAATSRIPKSVGRCIALPARSRSACSFWIGAAVISGKTRPNIMASVMFRDEMLNTARQVASAILSGD